MRNLKNVLALTGIAVVILIGTQNLNAGTASASITITPDALDFKEKKTTSGKVTWDSRYIELNTVKSNVPWAKVENLVKSDGTATFDLVFSIAGYATVEATFIDKDENDDEIPPETTATCVAVQVDLTGISNGDEPGPVISPKVCLNAQNEYKKATWKATVLPEGTTAHISQMGGSIDLSSVKPMSGIKNGDKIGLSCGNTGDYYLITEHDLLSSCTFKGESVAFKFIKSDETFIPLVTTQIQGATPSDPPSFTKMIGIYEDYVMCGAEGGRLYYYSPDYHKPWTLNTNSCTSITVNYSVRAGQENQFTNAEFSVGLEGRFKVQTEPEGAYEGKVEGEASTELAGKTHIDPPATGGVTNTAEYKYSVKIGEDSMSFAKGGNEIWDEVLSKKMAFLIPANALITARSHACAQRDEGVWDSKSASAFGSHDQVEIKKFSILKK